MNNNYYQNPIFNENNIPTFENQKRNNYNNIIEEQHYLENILRINKGKNAKIHITVPGSIEWQDKTFEGTIEQIGRDYIIISDIKNNTTELIPIIYIVFITLINPINYS